MLSLSLPVSQECVAGHVLRLGCLRSDGSVTSVFEFRQPAVHTPMSKSDAVGRLFVNCLAAFMHHFAGRAAAQHSHQSGCMDVQCMAKASLLVTKDSALDS